MGLQTENGNVFTHSYAISKRIKLEFPYWSQIKDLSFGSNLEILAFRNGIKMSKNIAIFNLLSH